VIDDGASRALRLGGSLLAVGITRVSGKFERGDPVRIIDSTGNEIARGLVNYGSADLERIHGHRSEEIAQLIGYAYGDEVIHRNDMVLL
jgi:glutamate 5-kinase